MSKLHPPVVVVSTVPLMVDTQTAAAMLGMSVKTFGKLGIPSHQLDDGPTAKRRYRVADLEEYVAGLGEAK